MFVSLFDLFIKASLVKGRGTAGAVEGFFHQLVYIFTNPSEITRNFIVRYPDNG